MQKWLAAFCNVKGQLFLYEHSFVLVIRPLHLMSHNVILVNNQIIERNDDECMSKEKVNFIRPIYNLYSDNGQHFRWTYTSLIIVVWYL